MSTGECIQLLQLLAQYATEYGKDCSPDMTVVELANDLAQSVDGQYAPRERPARWAMDVYNGLAS